MMNMNMFIAVCSLSITIGCIGGTLLMCSPFSLLPQNFQNLTLEVTMIRCSAYATAYKAVGYSYQGNQCELIGVGIRDIPKTGTSFCEEYPQSGTFQEVAKFKTTYATTSYSNDSWWKESGNDNNLDTDYASKAGLNPWWIVDLGNSYIINKISIKPRQSGGVFNFRQVEVSAGMTLITSGNLSSWTFLTHFAGPFIADQELLTLHVNGITARYIGVQIIGNGEVLQFSDVRVMGKAT